MVLEDLGFVKKGKSGDLSEIYLIPIAKKSIRVEG